MSSKNPSQNPSQNFLRDTPHPYQAKPTESISMPPGEMTTWFAKNRAGGPVLGSVQADSFYKARELLEKKLGMNRENMEIYR